MILISKKDRVRVRRMNRLNSAPEASSIRGNSFVSTVNRTVSLPFQSSRNFRGMLSASSPLLGRYKLLSEIFGQPIAPTLCHSRPPGRFDCLIAMLRRSRSHLRRGSIAANFSRASSSPTRSALLSRVTAADSSRCTGRPFPRFCERRARPKSTRIRRINFADMA